MYYTKKIMKFFENFSFITAVVVTDYALSDTLQSRLQSQNVPFKLFSRHHVRLH